MEVERLHKIQFTANKIAEVVEKKPESKKVDVPVVLAKEKVQSKKESTHDKQVTKKQLEL